MDAYKCIEELLKQLEDERRNVRREKLAVARLQREVARSKSEGTMREKLIHELEEERRLRLDSEKRLREVTKESELGQAQMVSLQQHFTRMEETVRTLLQTQGVLEQTAVDTVDIMKVYKDKLSEEVQKTCDSLGRNNIGSGLLPVDKTATADPLLADVGSLSGAEELQDQTNLLLERLRTLEEENSALAMENESQREQYERCLDEVANQVVQALLTQKDLREECLKLRTRVFDLEQQNRTMSVLFQQRVRPVPDLLLQKLHSRIMDLSAADLLLDPERSKSFLLSRNTDCPHDVPANVRSAGFPLARCLSQLSLTVPVPVYQRSSCSSSEMSLSSTCSEYSSGSHTWNDRRSCGRTSSLMWEKRLSLGSSAPGDICAPLEEQLPTRRKESHILEGLRKLQRRKPRDSSSYRVSKSAEKDCMNSNEGIYSLGIKPGKEKPTYLGRGTPSGGIRTFVYDSDDADDEAPITVDCRRDGVPRKDGGWMYFKKLSHSVSDSLCSWDGLQDSGIAGDSNCSVDAKHPPGYNSKERPEKLMSFINSFLSGGRTAAVLNPSLLHFDVSPTELECPLHLSDTDPEDLRSENSDQWPPVSRIAEQPEQKAIKRLSRDDKLLRLQCLRRDPVRTQSADGRPRSFGLIKEQTGAKTQSEESIMAIFDADGQPIELSAQESEVGPKALKEIPGIKGNGVAEYAKLGSHVEPIHRNYTVLESPEKPSESQRNSSRRTSSNSREGSMERLQTQLTPERKLIKPPSSRISKGHSVPPVNSASPSPKANGSKIPSSRGKGSPLKVSKGCITETSNSGPTSGSITQESKSPSSPPVKMSRFIKAPGCTTSPKTAASNLPSRNDWTKCSASSVPSISPHLTRRHLDHVDYGEQPTRDRHCEASNKTELRSPSPPPPPGRTTSLLIRPNYDGSPQALKPGAQPSMSTTVRGPPPNYHPPPVPNMHHSLPPPPYKGQDTIDMDAGYGTAIAPQKTVVPASNQTPSKGTSKRVPTKLYLPSSPSGPDYPENGPKSSKNVPPPSYNSQRGSSLQSTCTSKKGSSSDNGHPISYKTSSSLPVTLADHPGCPTEPHSNTSQPPQAVENATISETSVKNSAEKLSKTRIPMGFRAFVKLPPSPQKGSAVIPGKQEKDHINSVSKESVTSNALAPCDSSQAVCNIESLSIMGTKVEDQLDPQSPELVEQAEFGDKSSRDSRLFKRSISVTTKPHLKPALGMNGAKARSQSFSTNYMEKPNINLSDGHAKIRTGIITNSGERGNSLTRQSSCVDGLQIKTSSKSGESPVRSPTNRLSYYGGMTGSTSHPGLPERSSRSVLKGDDSLGTAKGENIPVPHQKEVRSLPLVNRIGLKNSRNPKKVASHPQFELSATPVFSPETTTLGEKVLSASKLDCSNSIKAQASSSQAMLDEAEQPVSPIVCTIEEKVMMGIEENIQKGQGHEKVTAPETKQKIAPSLANWFGLRKSKLPASNGKKSDTTSPKGKEEKKDLKIGSVLGGKHMKSDKKKDKKKNDSPLYEKTTELTLSENKLSSIMDHCNMQMGQIANQIHCSTTYIGKDQLMKELLGRSVGKSDSTAESLPGISIPKKNSETRGGMEICTDTATIIVTQKINLRGENEEATGPDHLIGSSCQMRTLDSGIGTFPLPDSVTRVNGRHIPKSESSPDRMAAKMSSPADPDQDLPSVSAGRPTAHIKVPQTHQHTTPAPGHFLSEPAVTGGGRGLDVTSRLPRPSASDVIRTKRPGQIEFRSTSRSVNTEAQEKHVSKKRNTKDPNSASDRALRVCKYSASSSDTETESVGNTLVSPRRTLTNGAKTSHQVDNDKETMKRSSLEKYPLIMDYHEHDVFSLEKEAQRRSISQYNLLHNQSSLQGKAGDRLSKGNQPDKLTGSCGIQTGSRDVSLESLNKLNGTGPGLYPEAGLRPVSANCSCSTGERVGDCCCGTADNEPSSSSYSCSRPGAEHSLSDSLYDSFSSCTSQGSNDV
ncbi:nck-associated protein 5 isoform X3 [Esox lucius]|nr:nck-associated protein 5 isoform X3 [Esox lucius]